MDKRLTSLLMNRLHAALFLLIVVIAIITEMAK
jgi:hypothetical protein